MICGCHRQTSTIDHAANVAIEFDEVQTVLGGFDPDGSIRPSREWQRSLAESSIVVDVNFGIQRDHFTPEVMMTGLISNMEQSAAK